MNIKPDKEIEKGGNIVFLFKKIVANNYDSRSMQSGLIRRSSRPRLQRE